MHLLRGHTGQAAWPASEGHIPLLGAAAQGPAQASFTGRAKSGAYPWGLEVDQGRTEGRMKASPPTSEGNADAFVQRAKPLQFVLSHGLPARCPEGADPRRPDTQKG